MLVAPPDLTLQVMGPDRIDWDQTAGRGLDIWTMIVQGLSGSLESQASQTNLDAWLAPAGTGSVKAAIEADRTLGGIVDDCWVRQSSGYKVYTMPSKGHMLGAEWLVEVLNSGT
jgi:hypothetical protein